MPVKGEFSARVRSQTCSALARLAVDRGRVNSSPLIGRHLSRAWYIADQRGWLI